MTNAPNPEFLNEYTQWLQLKGLSKNTIKGYTHWINRREDTGWICSVLFQKIIEERKKSNQNIYTNQKDAH
ncbi:MAG: hypothetical protein ACFFC7_26110 [Candidatus Hermodarchaeota archaeon]